jgi:branched-chain amino acid transport system substrate-binding protein
MKKTMEVTKKFIVISFLFIFLLPIASFGAQKTVNLGAACALSGGGAVYGIDFARGFQLAIDEINAQGGITVGSEKYKLNGITYDTELKPALSIKMALRLVNLDKCPAVFVAESTGALSVMKYNEKEKFLLMAVTVTPEFTQMGNKLAVRLATPYTKHIATLADGAWKKGIRKVAVYVTSFETSKRWGAAFEKVWQEKGGQIVGRDEVALGNSDHYSRLTKLIAAHPDAILVPSKADETSAVVVKQGRELGYKGKFMFTEALEGDRLISLVPAEAIEGTLLVNAAESLKRPELLSYRERYKAKYPDAVFQPAGSAAYEGVYVVAKSMEKAGSVTDVDKIRAAMAAVIPLPTKYSPAGYTKLTPEGEAAGVSVLIEFKNGKKEILNVNK